MTRQAVKALNTLAQEDFTIAKAALDAINIKLGTKYGWLNKRVVFFDNPDAKGAELFTGVHDLWVHCK